MPCSSHWRTRSAPGRPARARVRRPPRPRHGAVVRRAPPSGARSARGRRGRDPAWPSASTRAADEGSRYTRALQGSRRATRPVAARWTSLVGRAERPRRGDPSSRTTARRPSSRGSKRWLNSRAVDARRSARARSCCIDFWTYSCINCLRTLPYMKRWYETYRDQGLVIVGVHTPEFAFERDRRTSRAPSARSASQYPVALDPDYGTWKAWGNQLLAGRVLRRPRGARPLRPLRRGRVRGEGAVDPHAAGRARSAGSVAARSRTRRLRPAPDAGDLPRLRAPRALRRRRSSGDHPARYELPGFVPADGFGLGGTWTIEEERAVAGAARPCNCTTAAARCSSCSARATRATAGSASWSTGSMPAR